MDGKIKVTAFCEALCEKAWPRINSIMISPFGKADPVATPDGPTEPVAEAEAAAMRFQSVDKKRDINDLIQNLGCGHAFRGGSCETGDYVENCVF